MADGNVAVAAAILTQAYYEGIEEPNMGELMRYYTDILSRLQGDRIGLQGSDGSHDRVSAGGSGAE